MPSPPARVAAAVVCTIACAAAVAWAQDSPDPPPYPPPGWLVDVGGWPLHLHGTGEARPVQPTVILEAGIGDFSVEWSLVQPDVARSTRVCSYDRAGDGQRMWTWALGRLGHVAAAVNPLEHEELAAMRADRATREHPLDDLPLVGITRGISEGEGPDARAFEDERMKEHAAIAALSRNGKHVVAARSGHHVQLDEPGVVVTAIEQVVGAIRP